MSAKFPVSDSLRALVSEQNEQRIRAWRESDDPLPPNWVEWPADMPDGQQSGQGRTARASRTSRRHEKFHETNGDSKYHTEPPKQPKKPRRLTFESLADVQAKPVKWLWRDRIPCKFVLFTGPPDCGKTNTAIDIAARATTGRLWPDGAGNAPTGSVLYLTAEDGVADTIRPRAEAAKADIKRIHVLKSVQGEDGSPCSFSLQQDLILLAEKVKELSDVVLIIIDPITAYLGSGRLDTHKTADVRAVLSPLKDFAEDFGVTVLGLTHPSKTVTKAMNAVTGSQAFIAAARSAYLFTRETKDGEETGRTLMLPIKNNLGPRKEGLAFRIQQRLLSETGGVIIGTWVDWDTEPVTLSADDALAGANEPGGSSKSAVARAVEFLEAELSVNDEVPLSTIKAAARRAGISERSLERARSELKVKWRREGFGLNAEFYLSIPQQNSILRQGSS